MRAHLAVVPSPALDHDLGLAQAVEDLASSSSSRSRALKLSMKPFSHRQQSCRSGPAGIRATTVALKGAAWGDVGGLGTHRRDPCLDRLGHELGAVVGADV